MHEIRNPYPGLRSFEPYEASIFFGREKHIRELNQILLQKRFVAILGASGTGKSSLVKAGIIPHIQELDLQASWQVIHFHPGQAPLDQLSSALQPLLDELLQAQAISASYDLVAQTQQSPKALAQLVALHAQVFGRKYFVYIDQFEEIFRYSQPADAPAAQAWVDNLLELTQNELPLYLTLSLRSDYLGKTIAFSGLPELINRGNYLVPQLERHDLLKVITGPLDFFNIAYTSELAELMLADIDNSPEHLLVLQHALMRTYQEWRRNDLMENPISRHHYHAIGGVRKALSVHGEQILADLSPDDKALAERLFKSLLLLTTTEAAKTTVSVDKLAAIANQTVEKTIEVIDHFRSWENAFLHPHPNVKLNESSLVDLAHESVLQKWERGQKWILEEKNAAELFVRLAQAAQVYQTGHGSLWVNPELSLALNWQKNNQPNQAWADRFQLDYATAINFLEASHREYLDQLRRKELLQRRKIAVFRNVSIGVGIAAVVAIFLAVIALNLRYEAVSSEKIALQNEKLALASQKEAERQSREAISNRKVAQQQQQIAEEQKLLAEEQRIFAVHQQKIAIEQKRIAEDKSIQATLARNEAIKQKSAAETARIIAEQQRIKADSLRGVAEDQTQISERLRMLAIARSLAIQSSKIFASSSDPELSKLLAKEAYQLNKENTGPLFEPDVFAALSNHGNQNNVLLGHSDQVRHVIGLSNTQILTAADDGTVLYWHLGQGTKTELANTRRSITALAADSALGKCWVQTDKRRIVQHSLWVPDRGTVLYEAQQPIGPMAYTQAGLCFAQANKLFALPVGATAAQPNVLFEAEGPIQSFSIDASGYRMAMVVGGKGLVLLDLHLPVRPLVQLPLAEAVGVIGLHPTEPLVAYATMGYELMLWNYQTNELSTTNVKHQSPVTAIRFNPRYPLLASASYDRSIRLWFYASRNDEPVQIPNHESWVHAIAFVPDGSQLASVAEDRTLRVWKVLPEWMHQQIQTLRRLTPEEEIKYIGQKIESTNGK